MPSKPLISAQSPPGFWLLFLVVSFVGIALFVLTISWLDVDELSAIAIGAAFAAAMASFFLAAVKHPLRSLAQASNEWCAELEQRIADLRAQHSQAQAILGGMAEGVCALNVEGRLLWLNRSAEQLLGVGSGEAAGKRLVELVRQPELEELFAAVSESHTAQAGEVQLFAPFERTLRFQATPCDGGEGGAALVVVMQDVTEVRKLERLRRDFVANVSHELKTPLTSIQGLVETLLGGALEDSANNRRFVTLIEEDAARLSRLIDDLLELSQIESKVVPLRMQPVNLRECFEELLARFRNQADAGQVGLVLEVPAETPNVLGDSDKLRQVFVNLIDNAIKFNRPQGSVTIGAQADAAGVRISVADTGAGIPENDLPRIFERFYRVDKARSRELGGTGLGLSIVKHLVELHRGRITVESRPGEGSIFTVVLPRA